MVSVLKVNLWGKEIGRLAWDERRRLSYFTYNPEFLSHGLEVAPIVAPLVSFGELPVWGREEKIYQRLPSFIADSLPDAWGNQLFDIWRRENHLSNADITPLDKLSFIGKRGMGALEFEPQTAREHSPRHIDLSKLTALAHRISSEREKARILPDESITMQSLLTVGTSAGGRQPKAIIAINRENWEIRSGQIAGLKDYDYYLLKFGNQAYNSAELEMTYYKLATAAGITMMPSRLYTIEGQQHFMTMRFDRKDGEKLYTQTLAAIDPEAESYEQLIAVCRRLHVPEPDCQQVFRRLVFNILANNTDDHNKNFSFIMDKDGSWHLAPAYDMTYIIDNGGVLPEEDHCMYIRAKLNSITREDALLFAHDNGIRRPEAVIREVARVLREFRQTAKQCGVSERWTGRVEATIVRHLKEWGEWDEQSQKAFLINGHAVTRLKLVQTYKGNYHLLATVDGKERKFVIGKNKEEYSLIERKGIENITGDELKAMAHKYFKTADL